MELKEIVKKAMSYTTQHQDKEDYHDYVIGAMQRIEVYFDAVSTLEIKRLIEEIKQESTEMTFSQQQHNADIEAINAAIDILKYEGNNSPTNNDIQDVLSSVFFVSMTTGEISDIRNELDSEKEHKYNPRCLCAACEEISAEKERENECLHMRNMRLPIGGYWHNAY